MGWLRVPLQLVTGLSQQPEGALHHAVAVSHQTWNSAFLAANNLCQAVYRGKW